jgi:hypothetical protein
MVGVGQMTIQSVLRLVKRPYVSHTRTGPGAFGHSTIAPRWEHVYLQGDCLYRRADSVRRFNVC